MENLKFLIKKILSLLPLRNIIVFESVPSLSDNSKAVFDEFIKRGYNDKYKFIWIVYAKSPTFPNIKNVKYIESKSKLFPIKRTYYRIFAKALISCNMFLPTLRSGQVSFYTTHGTPVKSLEKRNYILPKGIDYMLINGEATKELMLSQFDSSPERTVALGYPRNDVLVKPKRDISELFPNNRNDKKIVWYPTFRLYGDASCEADGDFVPILHNRDDAARLNSIAAKNNILIIMKPHFAQNLSNIKECKFSNIQFIDEGFFAENKITSYEFIAACDALITDYSSVYFDYLLCDKPIGLIWEDYDKYKKFVDFAVDMDYYMKGGEKIYNIDDFEAFIKQLASDTDPLKSEREEISNWANYSKDGKSSARVADFIIKKAKL